MQLKNIRPFCPVIFSNSAANILVEIEFPGSDSQTVNDHAPNLGRHHFGFQPTFTFFPGIFFWHDS
jgi:hypothetical protein